MKTVLLINLPDPQSSRQKRVISPPIGLWAIRSYLERRDVFCYVHDMNMEGGYPPFSSTGKQWDLVGLSCRYSQQHDIYEGMAAYLKKLTPLLIAGGQHASAVERPKGVSLTCKGSGEQFIAKLLGLPDTPPRFVFPRFSSDELRLYHEENCPHDLTSATAKWLPVETSRGCGRRCGFCGVSEYWGSWRDNDINGLERYLAYLVKEHGIEELLIEDDQLTFSPARFIRITELLRAYGIEWSAPNGISVAHINSPEMLRVLARSTCWRLSLPLETGTRHSADLMGLGNKWIDPRRAEALILKLKDIGIKTCGFFVIGYPGEIEQDVTDTLAYANSLPLDDRHIYCATPYPGTQLHDSCVRNRWLTLPDGPELYRSLTYTRSVITTPWLSADRVTELREQDRAAALERRKKI